ncbi:hypothetical protein CDAR_304301 [Caerostris darwini]|uniref:Voltage-dependent calcium channel alpha-2/delta subunit conserved region domain-containing protein n=1 Tax=Caerostris darwini TaxID=1538125 RepID=A0AAV4NWZ9_9ARAC|nr:hypothetical protein CDAR_304301 [Caerostris darwini]
MDDAVVFNVNGERNILQFIVQEVPYTNLVMLVVHTTCPCETTSIKLEPKEVNQNETQRCQRMKQNIYGRRPTVCLNYHPQT